MKPRANKVVRCAIYTRKSTEHGLDLEFNSLDAQREACDAYVKSQLAEGWCPLPDRYDDPAYSGGNMDRPALKQLLADIEAGLVDVVLVYKIDRLTRSLADFAKLVDIFDAKSVSFVAITQQFNTTTSMGRLTLNVLLSFAQFERELSSERVRDKVAASRKKGKWTGGSVPLGYDRIDKKLAVNKAESKTVQQIFEQYLALKSVPALTAELGRKGVLTKVRYIKGKKAGGIPFTHGSLAYLLKNRVYIGEIGHNGKWFPGEHEPIIEAALFKRVQSLMKENAVTRQNMRHDNNALLSGLIFDDRGNRMTPSFTVKNGVRYPFYISTAILKGRKSEAGSVARIPAAEIEKAVVAAIKNSAKNVQGTELEVVAEHLQRVNVRPGTLEISLKSDRQPIEVAWSLQMSRNLVSVHEPPAASRQTPNAGLVQAVVRAYIWTGLLTSGVHESIEELSQAVDVHPKVIRSAIRLAFLAPQITETILCGDPIGFDPNVFGGKVPLAWSAQRRDAAAQD